MIVGFAPNVDKITLADEALSALDIDGNGKLEWVDKRTDEPPLVGADTEAVIISASVGGSIITDFGVNSYWNTLKTALGASFSSEEMSYLSGKLILMKLVGDSAALLRVSDLNENYEVDLGEVNFIATFFGGVPETADIQLSLPTI